MRYKSEKDQTRHITIANAIALERRIIIKHHKTLKELQNRLMNLGTPEEVLAKSISLENAIRINRA